MGKTSSATVVLLLSTLVWICGGVPAVAQFNVKPAVRILGLEKAMPTERVDDVFRSNSGNQAALPARDHSPIKVYVRRNDSLSRLVDRHWGIQLTLAKLAELETEVLQLPQNSAYLERSKTKLVIRPEDILYLPRTVGGLEKTGPLVIPGFYATDGAKLRSDPSTVLEEKRQVKPLASSFDYQSCEGATSTIFDEDASNALKVLAKRSVVTTSPITVAVIDTALNGQPGWLLPWLVSVDGEVGLRATGAMLEKGGVFIQDGENDHGSHIVSLVLGGKTFDATRASRDVSILPIVVQKDYVDSNGTWKYQTNATWISKAIRYAKNYDARIVNISFESQAGVDIAEAIRASTEPDLRLYVVAAGNSRFKLSDGETIRDYLSARFSSEEEHVVPAMLGGPSIGHVVSVAAMTRFGTLAEDSARSKKHVDIVGPGECLGGYGKFAESQASSKELSLTGTSQAAASVSFASTLIAKSLGYVRPAEIKSRLFASSVHEARWETMIASSGRLSITRAVAVHEDIVSIRRLGGTQDYYGSIQFDPKKSICLDKEMPLRNVWKAVRSVTDGGTQTFKYVQRSPMPQKKGSGETAKFEWDWQVCTANFGNLREVKIKTEDGMEDLPFDAIQEIVPRHL